MANRSTHATVGALAGLAVYGLIKRSRNEDWTLGGTVAALGCGAAIGISADVFEPALNPNHRGPFHSVALLTVIAYANKKVLESTHMTPEQKISAVVASAAYASHLFLDAVTPKGLPLLGIKN